jgi:predicted GIY-YIG superfamily endonuclease|uniref:GIY-YIG domain-containing protein n=1 Tax=viral metagenome TaxID=1070528 RepID=A0A6C0JUE5_9ZZZZ
MEYIYILKLKNNKYYIGKTQDVENRFKQHINGVGSSWTKKYKPISIIKQIKSTSQFDEDKYVKEYMAKYGIENVRGGTYTSIELDDISLFQLQKELWHSKNLCTRCGRNTHFIKDCYAKTDIDGNILEKADTSSDYEDTSSDYENVWCCSYCNKEFETENGARFHENNYCKKKYNNYSYKTNNQKYYNKHCDICGKSGHREENCYFL